MYAVLNMGYTPSQYVRLTQKERAFIIASIMIKIEEEKKQNRKISSKARTGRRR